MINKLDPTRKGMAWYCNFSDFHKYIGELYGQHVHILEMGSKGFLDELKELSKPDFMKIVENLEN